MPARLLAVTLITACTLFSCYKFKSTGNQENRIISVETEDKEMNAIIADARKTIPLFTQHLLAPAGDEEGFAVKFPFQTDPGSESSVEHIWLEDIRITKGVYSGLVANDPYYIKKMKYGDRVTFDPAQVSDWKYVKAGYLTGGKSIVYMLKEVSAAERKHVLSQIPYKIREFE